MRRAAERRLAYLAAIKPDARLAQQVKDHAPFFAAP
jgi:hypothetical protein